jgi:hypothetical protein
MDVYLSLQRYIYEYEEDTLTILGVASTPEKAKELWKSSNFFTGSTFVQTRNGATVEFTIEIATLDKPLV